MDHATERAPAKRGRPPLPAHQRLDERIEVRLTDAERRDLARVAREKRTSIADVLREAVNEYVADYGERPIFSVR